MLFALGMACSSTDEPVPDTTLPEPSDTGTPSTQITPTTPPPREPAPPLHATLVLEAGLAAEPGHAEPQLLMQDDVVLLDGVIAHDPADPPLVAGDVLTVLPEQAWPHAVLPFNVATGSGAQMAQVDVHPDGSVVYVDGPSTPGVVSLGGIVYSKRPGQRLGLLDKGVNVGGDYADASAALHDDLVVMAGFVLPPEGTSRVAAPFVELSEAMRPDAPRHFAVHKDFDAAQASILDDAIWKHIGTEAFSLSGIAYSLDGGTALTLGPDAAHNLAGSLPRVSHHDEIVLVTGTMRARSGPLVEGQLLATLPLDEAPDDTRIFAVQLNCNHDFDSAARVDVYPDGDIVLAALPSDVCGFVSIDNIRFAKEQY